MTYTLNYRNNFDEIKSMNTATDINLILNKDGLPFDLTNITDNIITIKIANQNGYIKDLSVNISDYTNEEKASGTFTLYLDDEFMKTFPPDIYYLEVWINTSNNNRIIFPSNDDILPFTVNSNIVNGSRSIPMVTFYQVKQDMESTKQLVLEHEAKVEKYINSLDGRKDDIINDINTKIQDYYKFSNNIKTTLNSLNSKVFNESNNLNGKIDDISSNVSAATNTVNNAGNNVKNSVENIIISARSNINHDINTNSAINLINSGAANADSRIINVVDSAKTKLISIASELSDQVNILTKKGSKQINVTAGSAAANLTSMTRDTINTGNNATNNILSTASSATTNVSNCTSSFDDKLAMTTNNLDNFISDTKYNYSNLNNKVTNFKNTISDTTSSAFSYMNNIKDTNTSQMVSKAVSDFHKSTGINDDIPKSIEDLTTTNTKLQKLINDNTHLINSYQNKYDNSYNNNKNLITDLSSSVSSTKNKVDLLSNSNKDLSQSFSSLTSEALVTHSDLSSSYDSCYNQAKSYTDSKAGKSSDGNELQKMKDYTAGNLVPLSFIEDSPLTSNDFNSPIQIIVPVQKGKSYYFSCLIEEGAAVQVKTMWEKSDYGYPQPIANVPAAYIGQTIKVKFKALKDGYMPLQFNGDSSDIKISHPCVTQSETYVPFNVAEKNRIGNDGLDLLKPNLLPITTLTEDVTGEKYRIFNVPVRKGKTYWISYSGGGNSNIRSPKDGDMSNVLIDSVDYDDDIYNSQDIRAYKWISDRNGTLSFGMASAYSSNNTLYLEDMCVTETKNYLPFEIAQENRENIQNVFNSMMTPSK